MTAYVPPRIVARLVSIGVSPVGPEAVADDAVLSGLGRSPAVLRIAAREDLIVAREAARTVAPRG